jgi:inner membrane protein
MDNVTHALAGALLAAATCQVVERRTGESSTGFRRAAFAVGVVTAELPDADLVYSGTSLGIGKLGYLLHHRGHTHTVLFALLAGVVVWAVALALSRSTRASHAGKALLGLSVAGTLSHLLLDYTNSYGVHPWWPLDKRWFYGDAVFIVEPWLWIVALPPLFLVARGALTRGLCGLLLAGILVAAWRVEMVGREVAAILTVGAVLWAVIVRVAAPARRVAVGLVGWVALEAMFFLMVGIARADVRQAVGPALRDVVLTPSPGNPLCLSAIVVTEEAGRYAATRAAVAPLPEVLRAAQCRPSERMPAGDAASGRGDTPGIRWGASWSAPAAELVALSASHCEVAAALRFIRVPVWRATATEVMIWDLRFGDGVDGFAGLVTQRDAPCPHPVPDWEWPRQDVLGHAP